MVEVLEKTPKLSYNSFAEPNRRREAKEALRKFIESDYSIKLLEKWMCDDDILCIVEMLVEEKRAELRRLANPYFIIENAELVE